VLEGEQPAEARQADDPVAVDLHRLAGLVRAHAHAATLGASGTAAGDEPLEPALRRGEPPLDGDEL